MIFVGWFQAPLVSTFVEVARLTSYPGNPLSSV